MAMNKLKIAQSEQEISNLIKFVTETNNIGGDIFEAGVYEGGTGSVILDVMNKNKKLYLFDTFHDFYGAGKNDPEWIAKLTHEVHPQLKYSYQNVIAYFDRHNNVRVYKGPFPQVIGNIFDDKKISFAHLDMDIYQPTLDALNYIYPKMPKGGAILVHDYSHSELQGVKQAVDEFFADKLEKPLQLGHYSANVSQAVIAKQ